MDLRLCFLFLVQMMGNGDMPIAFRIDTRHLCPEKTTVRGGVKELIYSNIMSFFKIWKN
jgi:hypothetical protein